MFRDISSSHSPPVSTFLRRLGSGRSAGRGICEELVLLHLMKLKYNIELAEGVLRKVPLQQLDPRDSCLCVIICSTTLSIIFCCEILKILAVAFVMYVFMNALHRRLVS